MLTNPARTQTQIQQEYKHKSIDPSLAKKATTQKTQTQIQRGPRHNPRAHRSELIRFSELIDWSRSKEVHGLVELKQFCNIRIKGRFNSQSPSIEANLLWKWTQKMQQWKRCHHHCRSRSFFELMQSESRGKCKRWLLEATEHSLPCNWCIVYYLRSVVVRFWVSM